jgi:hypothetical protein
MGSVAFHEAAWKVVLAALSPEGPARDSKRARAVLSQRARTKVRETEGKREWRQGCQRLDRIVHRGKTTPTLVTNAGDGGGARRSQRGNSCTVNDPPKRPGRRDTSGPRSCCAEPETPRSVHAMKVAAASRECARCGCSRVVQVAEVGRTRRAFRTPASRETWW